MAPKLPPKGPVALLVHSLSLVGAALDEDLKVKEFGEADICICHTPYQQLKPLITQLASRARTKAAADIRRGTAALLETDGRATRDGTREMLE